MSAAADPEIGSIGQISIAAQELERAVRFYRDVLGLTFLFQAPPGLAFFECGGVRLMLSLPEGTSVGTSVIYYRVGSVEAAHAACVERGAEDAGAPHLIAKMSDHELWMGFLKDSEGNLLGLMEERRPGPLRPAQWPGATPATSQ